VKVPLGKRDLDTGLFQVFKDGEIELAPDPFLGNVPDVDPDQELKVDGTLSESDEPHLGLLEYLDFGMPFRGGKKHFSDLLMMPTPART
jgi:hypothetical protein